MDAVVRPNPFWSENTQANWGLQQARPRDLPDDVEENAVELPPVPGGDEDPDLATSGRGRSPSRTLEDGTVRSGATSLERRRTRVFVTPASWGSNTGSGKGRAVREGIRSQGEMPIFEDVPVQGRTIRQVLQEEGERQAKRARGSLDARIQDDLERAMEREMFLQLQEENSRLKSELDSVKQGHRDGPHSSEWSEVSATAGGSSFEDKARYTPNGTRVPDGPPPVDPEQEMERIQVPPWPLEAYEFEEVKAPCRNSFTNFLPPMAGPQRKLRDQEYGGGTRSGQGFYEGGTRSRQGLYEEERDVQHPPPPEWSMRFEWELMRLKQRLDEQTDVSGLRGSEYWSQPFQQMQSQGRPPWEQGFGDGRDGGDGRHGRDRASASDEVRGNVDGRREGDRASTSDEVRGTVDSRCGRDRAGTSGKVHGDDDSRQRGDRAGIREEVRRDGGCGQGSDRAFNHGEFGRDDHGQGEGEWNGTSEQGPQGHGTASREWSYGRRIDRDEDNLKSIPITLPVLPPPQGHQSSIEAGDWLAQVRPYVADVAPHAGEWWDWALALVTTQYTTWLGATALDRLKIDPPDAKLIADGKERLEQRITTLLLSAIPAVVKADLVANRQLHVGGILLAIYKRYQPGGHGERHATLQALTQTTSAGNPTEAVNKLREWKRRVLRAQELSASLPDPTIQVRALDVIVEPLLRKHTQMSFRISAFRMAVQLDNTPSQTTTLQFYDMLLSEMEQLQYGVDNNAETADATPKIKAVQSTSMTESAGNRCRNWGTEAGCRYGRLCRFEHPSLPDAATRCWHCSSPSHRNYRSPAAGSQAGGSEDGGKGGKQPGGGKGPKGGKTKQKGGKGSNPSTKGSEEKGSGTAINKMQSDTTGGGDKGKGNAAAVTQEGKPQQEVGKEAQKQEASTGGSGDTTTLVSEVTSLLRSLRVGSGIPQLNAISLKRIEKSVNKTTLLDGGATHCLRPMKNQAEWEWAMPCRVSLATGSVELRQVPDCGTLITNDLEVQRIVPIRELVRMGIKVALSDAAIEMTWPNGERLPVWLDSGCPVVDDKVGKQLMEQIEEHNMRIAGIKKVFTYRDKAQGGDLIGEEDANQAMELSQLFPEVPHWLIGRIPGAPEVDNTKVPLNRRTRRRIREAGTRILHLFSGKKTRVWTDLQNESLAVVCIEIEKGTNMLDDNLYAYLLDMAKDGLWDMILAGPPCRTVSLQRYREDGGPRPLSAREGVSRFGLSWNSARQQEECNQDSLLWLRTLFLMYTGKTGNPHLETLLEQPADPETWVSPTRQRPFHGFASYLAWPETGRVGNILQMKEGHSKVKPTTLMTDIAEVLPLHGLKADRGQCASWSDDLETRLQEAREAAEWSPGLVQVLQTAIRRKQQSAVYAPRRGQVMRNPEKWRGFLEQQRRGRERLGLPPRPDEYLASNLTNGSGTS